MNQRIAVAAAMKTGFVIDPRNSKFMPYWDMVMLAALIFVAVVTPFEVTFLEERSIHDLDILFVVNRFIDFCFLVDMFLCFNLSYQAGRSSGVGGSGGGSGGGSSGSTNSIVDMTSSPCRRRTSSSHRVDLFMRSQESSAKGAFWVHEKGMIIRNYVQGWFIVDLISVIPFFAIGWAVEGDLGSGTTDLGNPRGTNLLGSVRAIKLFRMLKLARILKASRIIKRQLYDVLMSKMEFTYAVLTMVRMLMLLILWAHWQACLWGLGSSFMSGDTWLTTFENSWPGAADGNYPTAFDTYAAALYWSVMTLTSIGYGEMLPVNTTERVLCCFYMIASGGIWTYVIGTSAGIASTLDPCAGRRSRPHGLSDMPELCLRASRLAATRTESLHTPPNKELSGPRPTLSGAACASSTRRQTLFWPLRTSLTVTLRVLLQERRALPHDDGPA